MHTEIKKTIFSATLTYSKEKAPKFVYNCNFFETQHMHKKLMLVKLRHLILK